MKAREMWCALLVVAALAAAAFANAADEQLPDWARPTPQPSQPGQSASRSDAAQRVHVPGSTVTYTEAQIENERLAKDWFPKEHPPMPRIVAGAPNAKVFACAHCHMTNGNGHPETAALAGLPPSYFAAQIADMKSGARQAIAPMNRVAGALSAQEVQRAAAYFAQLKPTRWVRVVESTTAPRTTTRGYLRISAPGTREPLGRRIIELPQDDQRVFDRDPHVGFVAYVPVGSVAAGRALVTGQGATVSCDSCHGANLQGDPSAGVPWIAGRSPVYVYRQLWDFKHGTRHAPAATAMKAVTAELTDDQMIAIAAYVGTLTPQAAPK